MLLGKEPGKFEVYNDIEGELVNFFRVVKNRPAELLLELDLLPLNSREEFTSWLHFHDGSNEPNIHLADQLEIIDRTTPTSLMEEAEKLKTSLRKRSDYRDVRQAAAYLMRVRNSYSSSGRSFACQPFSVRTLFTQIWEMSRRLENVIIEQQSFEVLIPHYDREDSFFYGDPPYYDSEYVYDAEFGWDHHVLLRDTLLGLGCDADEEEAQTWFRSALETFRKAEQTAEKKGYLRYRIGKCHAHGHGTEQNYEESARWFRQAVDENNPFAAYSLGGQYLRGQGVEQSSTEAYRLYTMAAVRGNAYAQYQLGRMYRDGVGAEADLEESKRWYAKAYAGFLAMEATMADDKLCYRIGSMNMTGTGTEVDLEKSRYYFEKAVELGSADALYGLGKLYLKPEFSEYDPEKAVEYLEQAAAKDNAFARYQLGKLFCQGKLVQKDIARGLPLLEELAEAGVTSAAYIAGKVYLKEEGWQDVQKAIRCFHMAAEDGNSYAEYQLGKIYYFGNGIRVDREKGLEYLNRSAAHGNMYAENLLRVIRQQHIRGAASLIAQLGRMFQEKEQQDRVQHQQPDRKQRRQIDEKKQALGIRD